MSSRKRHPMPLADALAGFLESEGLSKRIAQVSVVDDWPELVGPQIAAITTPLSITADGTLFVAVATNSWMTELSLMEPQLLSALNVVSGRPPVRKIRLRLRG